MTTLNRRFGGTAHDYPVYSRSEAEAHDDPRVRSFRDWREGRPGQFVVTDDGLVCEAIYHREVKSGRGAWASFKLATPLGIAWQRDSRETGEPHGGGSFLGQETLDRFAETGNVTDWATEEARKGRARRAVRLLARFWVVGDGHVKQADWDAVGEAYRPDSEVPRATAKRFFLRTPQGETMLQHEVEKLLNDMGLDKETVVKMHREVFDESIKRGQPKVALDVLDRLRELQDLQRDTTGAAIGGYLDYEDADYEDVPELGEADVAGLLDAPEAADE